MRHFVLSLVALTTSALLVGCGGGTPVAAADSGVTPDGATSSPGLDGSASDGNSVVDSATPTEDAGPNCAAAGATTDQCRTCCATAYPGGSNTFDQLTLACACQASLCGPPDGGIADAGGTDAGDAAATDAGDAGDAGAGDAAAAEDGGTYGTAVCAATCNGTAEPDALCNACFLDTLGSEAAPGPCGDVVLSQCITDVTCGQYFSCVDRCPN